jgi:hypothetical protein
MHCSDEELRQNNLESARVHISECMHCQQRLWQLKQLCADGERMEVYQPPPMAWGKVKQHLPKPVSKAWTFSPLTIAASFIVGIIVTLVGNSMWQSQQIDIQIVQSNQLEKKLVNMHMVSPGMGTSLYQLSQIDAQLNTSVSKATEKALWKQRNLLLKRLLTQKTETRETI